MNESETRAELIDPLLKESGWGLIDGSKVYREYKITDGRIQGGGRAKALIADYILEYNGRKLAIIEAKSDECEIGEGIAQAKNYAEKMKLETSFSCNGKEIYQICLKSGKEGLANKFPTPEELWNKTFSEQNDWNDKFNKIPFEDVGGTKQARYYQEIAVNNTMQAIAGGRERILLTLATGTGKTFIAFQIAWKLFQTRWNLRRDGTRRPRILFLADRNILADQAYNSFSAFAEDALVRINPKEISKLGRVPTNGNIFFTIFQTFMSGPNGTPYFGDYPKDYFDFIIIDECHRGGANDESNWRSIMDYFSPAVQLGLTATPRKEDNRDTYDYFGDPVFVYSLKDGINDGFLTPFKVRRIQTTLDDYTYTSDDTVVEGEVEKGKIYVESDFNRIIEIKEREKKRVEIYLEEANQNEKAIVFCATQDHAAAVRELINQIKESTETNYCVRVTANDGALGEQYLREFQDNEKTIPTILTTSQKLSTGVDARNIRNIVLLRPINSMIEFKQIIGRGTRLFEGKEYFTIYDFVKAYEHFNDPEWDGPPEEDISDNEVKPRKPREPKEPKEKAPPRRRIKIKLADGKEWDIDDMRATIYLGPDGKPMTAGEFIKLLFGKLPEFFNSEQELREIWSKPDTRKALMERLSEAGFTGEVLEDLQDIINAKKSDIFDALEFIAYKIAPITREKRVASAQKNIFYSLDEKQKEFIDFVLEQYIDKGVQQLNQDNLSGLLRLKYHTTTDAADQLGDLQSIRRTFIEFQKYLYS